MVGESVGSEVGDVDGNGVVGGLVGNGVVGGLVGNGVVGAFVGNGVDGEFIGADVVGVLVGGTVVGSGEASGSHAAPPYEIQTLASAGVVLISIDTACIVRS